jgi:plasmid replication initiation protein
MSADKLTVCKDNRLNEMRTSNMTLNERKLFSTYVSMLNPNDVNKKCEISFAMKEYLTLLGVSDKISYAQVRTASDNLLSTQIEIKFSENRWTKMNIFSSISFENGIITMRSTEEIKPLLFDLKSYTRYYLDNVLQLSANSSFRIYEMLKQYQSIGERIISIDDLKMYIGIPKNTYNDGFSMFRKNVIMQAQRELKEKTDITFDFEEIKEGRKIAKVRFTIKKNGFINEDEIKDVILSEAIKDDSKNIEEDASDVKPIPKTILADIFKNYPDVDVKKVLRTLKKNELTTEYVEQLITEIEKHTNIRDTNKLIWYCLHNAVKIKDVREIINGSEKQPKIPKRNNFIQREYDDDFFEKISKTFISEIKGIS